MHRLATARTSRFFRESLLRTAFRANAETNFRNGGSAEESLARRGGRLIPLGLGLPTQHSQRPLAAPALSQAILSELLARRPGRNGLSAVSEAQSQGLRTLAFASSWQTGHFASAIWKFLSAFALADIRLLKMQREGESSSEEILFSESDRFSKSCHFVTTLKMRIKDDLCDR
jgi:hypothetical protein